MPARGLLAALLLLTVSLQSQTRLPIHVESLRYPPLARQARINGIVILVAHIGPYGSVSVPKIGPGHPILVQAAEDNLKKWKFQSGESLEIEITYHFKLSEQTSGYETDCAFDLPNSVTISTDLAPVNPLYSSPVGQSLHR